MKLRMQASGLNLRLSEPEVQQLAAGKSLHEQVAINAEQMLIYRLELASIPQTDCILQGTTLRVRIPSEAATRWAKSQELQLDAPTSPCAATLTIERDLDRRPASQGTR